MTKTENYNLNQWEATDPIRREDFNADNAAIDAAIKAVEQSVGAAWSPSNAPWEMGTIDIFSAEAGDVLKTFDFEPSAIFLFAAATVGGSAINGNIAKVSYASDMSCYCYITLSGNTLTMTKIAGILVSELQYVALR